jgi:hypothetical protein
MKCISMAIATLCLVLASTASAQTSSEEIGGAGTPGFIPQFTRTHKIGNSNIFQSSNGNIGIGTQTARFPLDIFGGTGTPSLSFGGPILLLGELRDSTTFAVAVEGLASATSGFVTGVAGTTYSPAGVGVLGTHATDSAGGGGGVSGLTTATNGFAFGVRGDANGTSGSVIGVMGVTNSPQGDGGRFVGVTGASGTILRGDTGPPGAGTEATVFRVNGNGTVFADGGFQPNGADFAESMAVTGDRAEYTAGDLLVIDPTANRRVVLAQQPYSTLVAGIYSTKPGMLGTTRKMDESAAQNEVPLAVVGIVPCKVTAENGPIRTGDLLVTSSTPGHAMKGTERSKMLGAVVGKALEPLPEGKGVIQVLVTLQ